MTLPFHPQYDTMDCGPACLRMVAAYYGRSYSLDTLRGYCHVDREGVSMLGLTEAAEAIGFRALAVKLPFDSREEGRPGLLEAPLPLIVHWQGRHFVAVYRITRRKVWIADPAVGKLSLSHAHFRSHWLEGQPEGIALLLEPTPAFYDREGEKLRPQGLSHLWSYLQPYRSLMIQLIVGVLAGSVLQLLFPFLTQAIVDIGVQQRDIPFIYLLLLGQLAIFLGQMGVQVLQSFILLHIGARVNLSLLSDFLAKLFRLPLRFFDAKHTGDLLQRIADHRRIEVFLTQSTLSALFSMVYIAVFGLVLLYYHPLIFALFVAGSLLYLGWIFLFMKKRAVLDQKRFSELAENQSTIIELLQAMPEIKLQNSEKRRRWQWEGVQMKLFKTNLRWLTLTQYQDSGAAFLSQLKDILITFVAARSVITDELTLGMMLAVQYIAGQLNAPLQQLLFFLRAAQDGRTSLERMREIHEQPDEEPAGAEVATELPDAGDIAIDRLSFKYNPLDEYALHDLSLTIPRGKVTAIVGASGSGKTTLVKLLLGFYEPLSGEIRVGERPLNAISKHLWRSRCGAVLQDGYIFSDTLARNIAESSDQIDREQMFRAAKVACLEDVIESLPLAYDTQVGARGNGLSQGRQQRLLIARAVYKDPAYLFFDEATNALDAHHEKKIVDNLREFYHGRTVVVVAHRLSTVRDADQIAVLAHGRLVELGTHEELIARKGVYFELVKNQLEL
jgi:ATP-binding cassette subfamily B protein